MLGRFGKLQDISEGGSIEITVRGVSYKVSGLDEDLTADGWKEIFSKMLVLVGFSPDVVELPDGFRYEVKVIDPNEES